MRRRTLLAGLVATATGAATGYATTRPQAASADSRSQPTDVMSSTRTSRLAPRAVTAYVPPAGWAPAHRFAVGVRDFAFARGADRPLPTRVWYPATGSAGLTPTAAPTAARGAYPVVVFSHGLSSQPSDYAELLAGWARAGFVVAAPIYPHTSYGTADFNTYDIVNQPADAGAVLTQLLALNGGDPLSGHLDAGRVAAAGHSAGAITTAGLFSAARDSRLKAGILLAGSDFRSAPFTGDPAALLMVHGKRDDTVAYGAARTVFAAIPWSRAMLTVTDGGHQIAGGDIAAVATTTTEFLRWSLDGDVAARRRIPARAAIGGVATLEDQLGA